MLQAELQHPNHSMSQPYSYHCCTVSASMLRGRMRNTGVEMMLNSVHAYPWSGRLSGLQSVSVHVVSAMGELVLGRVTLPVQVGPIITLVE